MRLEFIPDEELKDLPKVTSESIIKRGKFHPEGLFSEQIFGPVNSYKCWCSSTYASLNTTCPKCGIKITSSSMRRRQFAVIEVDRVINPVAMNIILYNKKSSQIINKILNMKIAVYITEDPKIIYIPLDINTFDPDLELLAKELKCNVEDIDTKRIRYGLDAIFEIACIMCDNNKGRSIMLNKLKNMIVTNNFFTKYVVVIPPDLRPTLIQKKNIQLDLLNKMYLTLLVMLNKDIILTGITKHVYECKIQQTCNQISKYVFENIGKKSGLLRNKMSGKRIDFSARSVITVDPEVPLTHIKVSRLILVQLWKLEIAKILMKSGEFITFKAAFDYLQRIYEEYEIPEDVKKIIDEVATDKFIILNRQPTLHRGGMFAAKIIPRDGNVISINPLICSPLNADFDGDSTNSDVSIKFINKTNSRVYTITDNIINLKDAEFDV